MSEQSSTYSRSGISILNLLGVLFVGLKLTGYIDWSWWYVTLPFWAGLAVFLAIIMGGIILAALAGVAYGILSMIAHVMSNRNATKRIKARQNRFGR